MKIILKNADFSQSGFLSPLEISVVLGGIDLNTGRENSVTNRTRTDFVDITYHYIEKDFATPGDVHIALYDSSKNYIGVVGRNLTSIGFPSSANNIDVLNCPDYCDKDGNDFSDLSSVKYFRLIVRNTDTNDSFIVSPVL